jgi:hypothetical protein
MTISVIEKETGQMSAPPTPPTPPEDPKLSIAGSVNQAMAMLDEAEQRGLKVNWSKLIPCTIVFVDCLVKSISVEKK